MPIPGYNANRPIVNLRNVDLQHYPDQAVQRCGSRLDCGGGLLSNLERYHGCTGEWPVCFARYELVT